ncbi:MAG TPA: protein-tyrosine-phosphatase [Frankiaceae bacterium]|nr:protein-tyrosine-phosphatase [Frankiaceae bacterium]
MGIFDLLFVCTGNICRSPTAHLLAASRLPAEHFRVHSAGTHGLTGYPVEPKAARLLAKSGIGCDEFRATRLDAGLVGDADLVLTATRDHRTAVVTLAPDALRKTFTMREFARLLEPVPDPPEGEPVERARALVAGAAAQRNQVWAPPADDDVADPYGSNAAAYERAYRDITEALDGPLRRLAG